MTEKRGKFITVEGQDGAGKSSNLAQITDLLRSNNIDFLETREPGGTELAEKIRDLLLWSNKQDIDNLSELLLIFAARSNHLKKKIEPALNQGKWVVCDRFTDATFAYQGGGRDLPWDSIEDLQALVQGDLRPDLTLIYDVPVEIGQLRVGQRGDKDRFEVEALEFKQRVRQTYLDIQQSQSTRVKLIDASQDLNDVIAQTYAIVADFIEQQLH